MKTKRVLALGLSAMMAMGLMACGETDTSGNASDSAPSTQAESGSADAGNDSLTIWAWDEAFNIKAAQNAADIYRTENPDVELNIVTMAQDDIVAKLNTSLSAGTYDGLPDIVLIEDYKAQGYLTAYENEFADLTEIAPSENFAGYKTAVNQVNGVTYGVPFDSGVAATFYRTDLIEQAGYTQEDMQDLTWEKFIEIGKAVKEKTGAYMMTLDPSDIGQIRMMMQSAGVWYTDAEGNATIADNQGLKDAIEVYKALVESGCTKQVSDWDQFVGAFNSGEVATVPTGCWIAPSIQKAEDQSGKWAVAAFPRMEANSDSVNASSIGGAGWYVLKNAGHEELAKDFLSKTFASSVDLMNTLAKEITLVSTLNAAADAENYTKGNEFFGGQEIFKDFAEWQQKVPTVNYGLNTYALEDLMTEAVQAIVSGADIDSTLSDYQAQAEAAVAQ